MSSPGQVVTEAQQMVSKAGGILSVMVVKKSIKRSQLQDVLKMLDDAKERLHGLIAASGRRG